MSGKSNGRYILDENGEPVAEPDLMKWAQWYEKADSHLKVTKLDNVRISTIFLGLDYNHGMFGPPILWETMVFGGPMDMEQRRYRSRAEAVDGHAEMVKEVKALEEA